MIYLIVGISIFVAGMCVGAAFMFIYMTWDPHPRRPLLPSSQDRHELPWREEEDRIERGEP